MKRGSATASGILMAVAACALCFAFLFEGLTCISNPVIGRQSSAKITIGVQGNGHVGGIGADTLLPVGSRIRLVALPDSGFVFVGWLGLPFTTSNPLEFTVAGNLSIRACFTTSLDGLALVHAADSVFRMGAGDSLAPDYERPVHPVRFTHDFFIGRCEVRQGEFAALAGRNPAAGSPDVGDSLPVFSVSWYDAVLYCNRRSKNEHYDTVYSYTGQCRDSGCPFVLENLQIHYDRFGYRLPTEAEWEYACRAGSTTTYYWGDGATGAAAYAWYFADANGHPKPVGSLRPNAFGLCDMAGNVAEWVNDWLDFYPDSTVTDPVGPSQLAQAQYAATDERPLRGGSYSLGTSFLRSSSRKGPYATEDLSSSPYIGFRVALGAFTPGSAPLNPLRRDTIPVAFSCGKTDLFDFLGAGNVKIAFVTGEHGHSSLVYLDLSEPVLQLHRCGRDSFTCGTMIAPDGKYLAYSSLGEGSAGPGTLTVRRLDTSGEVSAQAANGYLPHFWVSPSSGDTFVIYADGASMNDQPAWHTEKTYMQKFQGGRFTGGPSVLWGTGSYHGGLSSDGRFLGTSYPVAREVDLQISDTNIFLFTAPYNGRSDPPTLHPQLCNLQMSPSLAEPGEALLLDFGDPEVNTLVGKSYGLHQIIFITTMRLLTPQAIAGWWEKPAAYDSWDFPHWSNNSKFAIAVAHPAAAGADDALYLIRRSDSSYLKVATGRNFSYPALWIDPSQVSDINDPYRWFGAYDLPPQWVNTTTFAKKLRLFWHSRNAPVVIAMGSSPVYYGFNPAGMAERTINAASVGTNPISDAVLCQDYLFPQAGDLKVLIFDLDVGFLNVNGLTTFPPLCGLTYTKGYQLDSLNDFYRGGLPQSVIGRCNAFTPAQDWTGLDSTGYELAPSTGNGWGTPILDGGDYDFASPVVQTSLGYLEALADSAAARHVHVVFVQMPENPAYQSTDMIGRYGPSIATYRKVTAWVDSLAQRNPYAHFWDGNNYGNHDFTSDEFLDCNHLNYKGGLRAAAKLDSLIQSFLQ